MTICNITMQVAWSIHDEWLVWMKAEHIPAIIKEGAFDSYQLSRLKNIPEEEGPTYCVQYYASQLNAAENFLRQDEQQFSERISRRWGTDCLAFRTIMEVIH